MKSFIFKVLAGLALAMSLGGCGSIVQESASDWLMHQPVTLDD